MRQIEIASMAAADSGPLWGDITPPLVTVELKKVGIIEAGVKDGTTAISFVCEDASGQCVVTHITFKELEMFYQRAQTCEKFWKTRAMP